MTPEEDLFEQIRLFLPKYLTPTETRELFSELSKFPNNMDYYWDGGDLREQLLQGDGWKGFIAIEFFTGARKTVSGVILSNSCDIALENVRHFPVKVLFCPLIELRKYVDSLRGVGKTDTQIDSILNDIRRQHVASIFYFPECRGIIQESLIFLDDIHAHPLQDFLTQPRQSLFKLKQYAFYLFLMKLSIHFSRFQEGVKRFDAA